jgi:hypothetical protein
MDMVVNVLFGRVLAMLAGTGIVAPHSAGINRHQMRQGAYTMRGGRIRTIATIAGILAVMGGWAIFAQDKYTVKVTNGLAFSEFRGYEAWQLVSISQDGNLTAAILANPVMIEAYLSGVPGDGRDFPDGAKMAKIH